MDLLSMFAAILIMSIAGTLLGVFTGMFPGIHVNNIAFIMATAQIPLIAAIDTIFRSLQPTAADLVLLLSAAVISAVITHTFVNFIPSVFLGAPEGETALSVLPGHRMLLAGRGNEAVSLSARGSMAAVVICIIALPVLRWFMGDPVNAYERMRPILPLLLLTIAVIMIITERGALAIPRSLKIKGIVLTANSVIPMREGHPPPPKGLKLVLPENIMDHPGEEVLVAGVVRSITRDSLTLERMQDVKIVVPGEMKNKISTQDRVWIAGCVGIAVDLKPNWKKGLWAAGIFIVSGIFGLILLSDQGLTTHLHPPIIQAKTIPGMQLLFPLFTGLFGLPTMLLSLTSKSGIPPQDQDARIQLRRKDQARSILTGTASGAIVGWYPGVTSAQASVLAVLFTDTRSDFSRDMDPLNRTRRFILTISAINTANAIFNIIALFTLLKARSGALRAVHGILATTMEPWNNLCEPPTAMVLLVVAVCISAVMSYFITMRIGRFFARAFNRIPYRKLVFTIILILVVMVSVFGGIPGLVVAGIATCLGLVPPLIGIRRVHLMGCILLPVILTLGGIDIASFVPGIW
jgi:TctA family transporter